MDLTYRNLSGQIFNLDLHSRRGKYIDHLNTEFSNVICRDILSGTTQL